MASAVQVLAGKLEDQSLSPRTHMVKWVNIFPQAVL